MASKRKKPKPTASDYLGALKDVFVVNPKNSPGVTLGRAAYDYLSNATPQSVAQDIRSGVQDAKNWAVRESRQLQKAPIGRTLQLMKSGYVDPLLEPFRVFQQSAEARAGGDEDTAQRLAAAIPLAVLGAVNPELKGAGKLATRAAERGALSAAEKRAAKTAATPISPQTKNPLMGVHNLNERKLGMVQRLGGLPVPSIAVVNPENKFEGFGNISLVAPQSLVTPKSGNPVYGSDVYSARFPALSDDETKIFKGYTDNGRRYSPLTLANAVREMRGNPRNAEGMSYGAGSVRAVVTPEFRSIGEMQQAREKIIPSDEFQPLKDEANDRLYALGEKFLPYSKYSRPSVLDFPDQLAEAARIGFRDLDYNYENLPPELLDEARDYLSYLRDMPTEYFEAKPQRGVKLGEFSGAVVPMDTSDEIIELLKNSGLTQIERYDADRLRGLPTRKEALDKFRIHRFSKGGKAR